jgi:hypothetical protein
MPLLLVVLLAVFGVGYFAHEGWQWKAPSVACPYAADSDDGVEVSAPDVDVEADEVAPAPASPWALGCQAKIEEATRKFEDLVEPGIVPGEVEVTRLPSGAEYIEYNLRTSDGTYYQITVTEEPQNPGEAKGWQGAPTCKNQGHGLDVVRHENGHLARVFAGAGGRALDFGRFVESATDACIEGE